MNTSYKIIKNKALIELDANAYPLASVKKAMFYYIDKLYMNVEVVNNSINVTAEKIDNKVDFENEIKEFINDCLRESLRYEISVQTKDIRELILGRALYSMCIKVDDRELTCNLPVEERKKVIYDESDDFDINDITVNWFNKRKEE